MTSSMEDCLNSDLIDGKALETLIMVLVRTLKRGNKKCSREEVSKLVSNTLLFMEFVKIFLTKHWIV